jgi:hypothetical protein
MWSFAVGCLQNLARNGTNILIYWTHILTGNLPQNWRGSVKARHFVMTLRDYFHEKWSTGHGNEKNSTHLAPITDTHRADDDWALAHLNVIKLQPISEAFDDDASGFITVAEANTFTTSRPLGWRYVGHP